MNLPETTLNGSHLQTCGKEYRKLKPPEFTMSLDTLEQRYLTAALGYLELGMGLEADAELERIDPFCRHLPEVLTLRIQVYRHLKKWELMETVAKRLAQSNQDRIEWTVLWAEAARHRQGWEAAKKIFKEAVLRHPKSGALHLHIARCECQLGDLDAAKIRVSCAVALDGKLKMVALNDPDLEAVW
jgi:tetratricopeptide (TPR) repeat protein